MLPKLPKPLVHPRELGPILQEVRLLDVGSGAPGKKAYFEAHLEGALWVDLEKDLSAPAPRPDMGGRHPLPAVEDWARRLGEWGIDPTTPVVVYDRQDGGLGARAWWMLRAVGHAEVALLDGGLEAARDAGLATSQDLPEVTTLGPYPAAAWRRPTVAIDEVERRRRDSSWRILDVRGGERFRGETEPFDPVPGHIPGAINLPYRDSLDEAGRFLSPEALRQTFDQALDEVEPERLIVHCGSGVTACHTLLALERAGLHGASLYVGSWSEWCRTGRPREP